MGKRLDVELAQNLIHLPPFLMSHELALRLNGCNPGHVHNLPNTCSHL